MSIQLSIGRLRATRQGKKPIKLQINEQTKANMQTDTDTENTRAVTRGGEKQREGEMSKEGQLHGNR